MLLSLLRRILIQVKYVNKLKVNNIDLRKNASIKISKNGRIIMGKVIMNENSFVCNSGNGEIIIGNNVSINRNSIIVCKSNITIMDGTSIGPNVCIYDHDHRFGSNGFCKNDFTVKPIIIGKNVWIGANVVILKGCVIGDNCIIGAGNVISGEIPPNSIVKRGYTSKIETLK